MGAVLTINKILVPVDFSNRCLRMIADAKAFAKERGIDPSRFEFQMLFGVRRDLQRRLVREGYNVRVYVPFGREWYPYFMRRLAERPANVIFLARNFFRA